MQRNLQTLVNLDASPFFSNLIGQNSSNTTWLSNCSNVTNTDRYHDSRCLAIFYARTIASCLSILGCLMVLFLIVVYRRWRHFTHRMIAYLMIPSIVLGCIYLYPHPLQDEEPLCQALGYLINTCTFAQRLLILFIVIHLVIFTIYKERPKYIEHVFVCLTCVIPPAISIVPFIGDETHYGYAGDWCWIKAGPTKSYNTLLRFVCLYLWIVIFLCGEMASIIFVITRVRAHIQSLQANSVSVSTLQRYKKQTYPLILYPVVNLLLAVPTCGARLYDALRPDEPYFSLYLLHCAIYPLWGFCNAAMYFLNRETANQLHPYSLWDHLKSWRTSSQPAKLLPAAEGAVNMVPDYAVNTTDNTNSSNME